MDGGLTEEGLPQHDSPVPKEEPVRTTVERFRHAAGLFDEARQIPGDYPAPSPRARRTRAR